MRLFSWGQFASWGTSTMLQCSQVIRVDTARFELFNNFVFSPEFNFVTEMKDKISQGLARNVRNICFYPNNSRITFCPADYFTSVDEKHSQSKLFIQTNSQTFHLTSENQDNLYSHLTISWSLSNSSLTIFSHLLRNSNRFRLSLHKSVPNDFYVMAQNVSRVFLRWGF